jgi:hypothetical protein
MGATIKSINTMHESIIVIQELLVGSKKATMMWTTLDYWKKL